MYKIEKYTEGTLTQFSLFIFKQKMKLRPKFKEKVNVYQKIEHFMRGSTLAADAKQEMTEKRIDLLTAGYVTDFFYKNEQSESIKDFLKWTN